MKRPKAKGTRAENAWIEELGRNGYTGAYRGQKERFTSGKDGADVEAPELDQYHFEIKHQEKARIWDWLAQAEEDAGARGKTPLVVFKRNRSGWKVAMDAETFFKLLERS